ncbi:MAG: RNA polymerase factor sigma-54 [Sphaerochaetaceae bacterium]|nr:RNA polymerase factor sigma-54 [Sphaerochaetaceae bacterium]
MDFAIGLSQTLKQEQTLSPQMLQSLALLPMPLLELQAHIQQEIESNPALEIPDSQFDLSLDSPAERSLDDRMDDAEGSDYEDMAYQAGSADPEASDRKQMMIENSCANGETLAQHLLVQLGETPTTEVVNEIAQMIISSLDANGFFQMPLEQLFQEKNFSKADIDSAVALLQSFDPAGVCVADFRASLILQAKLSGMAQSDLEIFSQMVNTHLEKLKAGKFKEVATSLKIPEEDLQTFFSILKGFTPYPGQSFSSDSLAGVEPDFSVHQKNGELVLDINRSMLPELSISADFEALADDLSGDQAKEAGSYIRESIRNARTLINQVNLRFKTLYSAALAIMEFQSEFFFKGPRYLKTMTLKDIAEKIGVHETTMSRLAQSKWVETDWGLLQLKYLFSQGVASTSDEGASVSRNAVKDMIAEIIREKGALSDQKISDLLLEKGIKCARRTVGKYRAELNIDSSYSR